MKRNRLLLGFIALSIILILSACGSDSSHKESSDEGEMGHSGMNMSGSGDVPEGLKNAENPTFPVGSKAVITEGHMEGMKGAKATIVGAYDTIAYAISYNPTNGGKRVTNHKWVIHEELVDAGDEPLKPGTEVSVNADHAEGMENSKATIDFAEITTVYMVDYKPTSGGKKVKNHKWVTEEELNAE